MYATTNTDTTMFAHKSYRCIIVDFDNARPAPGIIVMTCESEQNASKLLLVNNDRILEQSVNWKRVGMIGEI